MANDLQTVLSNPGEPNDDDIDAAGGIVVDWRDEEVGIVEQVAACLPDGLLSCDFDEEIDDLIVTFDGKKTSAKLTMSPVDRSVIICVLNRVMAGRYEIRAYAKYVGTGDTIVITVQSNEVWKDLETRYAEKVGETFVKFVEGVDAFAVKSAADLAAASPGTWDAAVESARRAQAAARERMAARKSAPPPQLVTPVPAIPSTSLNQKVTPAHIVLALIGIAIWFLLRWLNILH